jgi:histidyl-tRNA synthetase
LALNSPRGTKDLFGEDIEYRDFIIGSARNLFKVFNYLEIITPVFEYTELFDRGIGQSTDIVQKEMYTFKDRKGRSLTLRPEGTAPVVRALIEKKMYSESLPLKLFYVENMFRYERPQKGRMREFWQIGVEAAGTDDPYIDSEVIWLLVAVFKELGFKNLKLLVNSVGCSKCRKNYINILKEYLKPKLKSLCADCKIRYEKNPMRVFDCKVSQCEKIITESPKIYEHICDSCRKHFNEVITFLKTVNVEFEIKKDLVRGFDYYTKTVFEIISEDLENVQNALGGGGRYDKLIKQFGGPDIPAVGFAIGIDRTIVLMRQVGISVKKSLKHSSIFIVYMEREYKNYCLKLLDFFRKAGYRTEINYNNRSIGNHIKWAEKNSFSHLVIIGEDEAGTDNITIKDLKNFRQYCINWKTDTKKIIKILGSGEICND